jgi:hypothetical protein
MSYTNIPLENIIWDIIRKKQKLTEKELLSELKKVDNDLSTRDIYRALMVLELFGKIIVLTQKEGKLIMLRS